MDADILNIRINSIINKYKDIIYHVNDSEFGNNITIMKTDGEALYRASIPKDDNGFYIDLISVGYSIRKDNYGNMGLIIFEAIAKNLKLTNIYLQVKKGTWQNKWYIRNGYKYYSNNKDDNSYVWLIKKLSY